VKSLYAKFLLWLIRPALELHQEHRLQHGPGLRLVEQQQDIRRRVRSGDLRL